MRNMMWIGGSASNMLLYGEFWHGFYCFEVASSCENPEITQLLPHFH